MKKSSTPHQKLSLEKRTVKKLNNTEMKKILGGNSGGRCTGHTDIMITKKK
uniref:Class I lanthipeptide n=1 Tax=Roseihalotalea indica TaxID=2867963 RepID=A0AA49GTE0_9BACT|nr:class I lanthipeptide [Tunicatimonas sp. TK19036]